MNPARLILRLFGWRVNITVPDYDKCLICVAPHTSNWDFVLGKLAYAAVGRHAGFLMKESWFFPPLSWIFKWMGGIPVSRKHGSDLTARLVERFRHSQHMQIAITPEGTRKAVTKWRTGFLYIAHEADIPICLGVIDYGRKIISVTTTFRTTGNVDADMAEIKKFYASTGATGKFPDRFAV